jgi:hypothetical protein
MPDRPPVNAGLPEGPSQSDRQSTIATMICPLTGQSHRLFWMRSAWWCADCRQKIESCCEGGGCPSVAELQMPDGNEGSP